MVLLASSALAAYGARINFYNSGDAAVVNLLGTPTPHVNSGFSFGNTRTFTFTNPNSSLLTVDATAWSDTKDVIGPDKIETARLGRFSLSDRAHR